MTEQDYYANINHGQHLADQGLLEAQTPQTASQGWVKLDQAALCFCNAQDLHWQAYLGHQKFHLYVQDKQYGLAHSLAQQTNHQYKKAFDPRGQILFLVHWAQHLADHGSASSALSHLRLALGLAQDQAPDRLALVYSNLGAEYLMQGNFVEAIHHLDQALAQGGMSKGEETWCLKALGDAFMGTFHLQKAEKLYRKALKATLDQQDYSLAKQCYTVLTQLSGALGSDFAISDLGLSARSQLKDD